MLAIIGGTGIYQLEGMSTTQVHSVHTPFGEPSAKVIEGMYEQQKILFLARHGQHHELLPHEVNYRANIFALKALGATHLIGLSAVGSLQEEIAPGDLSIPDQYFDFVKGERVRSFFGNGLAAHISTAEPTCRCLADDIEHAAQQINVSIHRHKTYACVDGPRLGTKAESHFLRGPAACDLVGMTNVPEVFLAKEAQLAYCTITIATDYDCWQDDPSLHVTVEQVISRYGASLEKAKAVLTQYLSTAKTQCQCGSRTALSSAILTPKEAQTEEHEVLLDVLCR
jgi:5'-methylthioadenosine phosphorylase